MSICKCGHLNGDTFRNKTSTRFGINKVIVETYFRYPTYICNTGHVFYLQQIHHHSGALKDCQASPGRIELCHEHNEEHEEG